MSQTTITTFFNSRKRPASEDIVSTKNKIAHIDRTSEIKSGWKLPAPVGSKLKFTATKTLQIERSRISEEKPYNTTQERPEKVKKTVEVFAKKVNSANVAKINEPPKNEKIDSARKELSLGDIRKKLAGSSRLAELRLRADRISKGIQELKETTDKPNLKDFKSLDVDIPQSPSKRLPVTNELSPTKQLEDSGRDSHFNQRPIISPRKVVVSPVKSPSKVPAYIRHASLAVPPNSLPLPHQYRFLAELFRGMETVVSLFYNRSEKITFNKLKPSVQEMLKRNFDQKHLAQIKHLVPDFYNFEIQKIKAFNTSLNKEGYEMVISPILPNDIKVMNPSVLLERRRYFYHTLLQLVKKYHGQYLLTLDPPIEIPDEKLVRWHPEFELEKVPEVEGAKLPEMPNTEKYSSAQDVLAKARELFKCNTKMERALEKLAQAKARGLTEQEKLITGIVDKKDAANSSISSSSTPSGITILNPALRNLPASLLEKVKAKQAAKALEAMTRSSENEEKYQIYVRLPDLAKTLRNIFVTERKNVLALNVILSKLDSSFKSNVSSGQLQKDIKMLTDEAPEWIKWHEIRNTTYLKLDKNTDLKQITAKLQAIAEKYKTE